MNDVNVYTLLQHEVELHVYMYNVVVLTHR